jgi:membrane-associated phospholipid phosphatase
VCATVRSRIVPGVRLDPAPDGAATPGTDARRWAGRLARRGALLLVAFVALTLAVQAGLWRRLDTALVAPLVSPGLPCGVLRVGYALSPWLSAELTLLATAAVAALLWWRTRRWRWTWLAAGLLATIPIELAAKQWVDQPAPPSSAIQREAVCGREGYPLTIVVAPHSYPSGWATRLSYLATLGSLALAQPHRRARATLAAGTLLLAATRVLIGWHWPSDVAGALVLGSGCACLAAALSPLAHRAAEPEPDR